MLWQESLAESKFLIDSTVGMFLHSMRSWNMYYETQFSSVWISGLIDTKNSMFFIKMLFSLLLPNLNTTTEVIELESACCAQIDGLLK